MRGMTKTAAAAVAAVTLGAGAARAETGFNAVVSGVTMTQRENTRTVDIGYTLAGEAAVITLAIETNGVAIPDSAVTRLLGDVSTVIQPGARTITWNAGADWPEHAVTNARARVTAWSTNAPPQVMVVDLSKGTAASWPGNPYPVYYYTSLDALPGGGLSNEIYKTELLVMTKIPSGVFAMGDESTSGASVRIELTQDFYAGVYEVTQKQWYKITGGDPSQTKNPSGPVEKISYETIRGSVAQGAGYEWPANDLVYAESFIGRIRTKTGLAGFDLPTEAQWEYACRATTTTYYNDGIAGSATTQLDELAWWNSNSGMVSHTVGQKSPNRWGLCDMHGSVLEWCLDWPTALTAATDPKGALTGTKRAIRGGSWASAAADCRSAYRTNGYPSNTAAYMGFRLFRTLP